MNPKGYRCANCGKMLLISQARNIVKCEACGSEYKIEDDFSIRPLYVEQIPYDSHELKVCTYVPGEFLRMNPEFATRVTLEKMAEELSKGIMPFMEISSYFDNETLQYKLYGKLRVHVPRMPLDDQLKRAIPEYAKEVEAKR